MKQIRIMIAALLVAATASPSMVLAEDRASANARVTNTQQSNARQGGFAVQDSTAAYNRVYNSSANRSNQGFVRTTPNRTYGTRSYQNYYNNNAANYGGYGYGANIGGNGSGIYVGSGYPGGYDPYANYYRNSYNSNRNWRDRDGYEWGRDRDRDAFHRYHNNPGWEKHWEHHRQSMRGGR